MNFFMYFYLGRRIKRLSFSLKKKLNYEFSNFFLEIFKKMLTLWGSVKKIFSQRFSFKGFYLPFDFPRKYVEKIEKKYNKTYPPTTQHPFPTFYWVFAEAINQFFHKSLDIELLKTVINQIVDRLNRFCCEGRKQRS